jgi:hypothetical protein
MKHCLPKEETGCPVMSGSVDTRSQGFDGYASDDAEISNAPAYVEAEKKCEHGGEEKHGCRGFMKQQKVVMFL